MKANCNRQHSKIDFIFQRKKILDKADNSPEMSSLFFSEKKSTSKGHLLLLQLMLKWPFLDWFLKKSILSNSIVRAGSGIRRRPGFTFWLTLFQSYMLPLFFSKLFLYLVWLERRISRHVTCKRDNSPFLRYVLVSQRCQRFTIWLTFLKNLYVMPLGIFLVKTINP